MQGAKNRQEAYLGRLKRTALGMLEKGLAGSSVKTDEIAPVKAAVDAVRYFEEDLERMATWPYESMWKMFAGAASIQGVASIMAHWDTLGRLVRKMLG